MSHEGALTTVRHMFCRLTNYKNLELYVSRNHFRLCMYLHDLNTQDRRVIFGVSKTLCDFGHKNSFTEE